MCQLVRQRTLASTVLVVALLATCRAASDIQTKPVRTVCTSAYWPLSTCSPGSPPSGYDVELFKLTVERLARAGNTEWSAGNYTWLCTDSWETALADIAKTTPDRLCDVLVAGVSATPERKALGIQFSYPTLLTGRRIMIHVDQDRSMWSFFEPFEPSLWITYFATSVGMGLLLLLSEAPPSLLLRVRGPVLRRAGGLQWATLSLLLRAANQLSPRTVAGRLLVAGYAFLVFILSNMYISSMSALLANHISTLTAIKDIQDLSNLPVGIFVDDKVAFQRFDLGDLSYYQWATQADEDVMMDDLRAGRVRALILDAPWVKYTTAGSCDLFMVGDMVLPVNMGFAFPPDVPADYLALFDSSLAFLDDSGVLVSLGRQYLQPPQTCHMGGRGPQAAYAQVKLSHVAGLWVLLAGCVGLAALWLLGRWLARTYADRTETSKSLDSESSAGGGGGAGGARMARKPTGSKLSLLAADSMVDGSETTPGSPVTQDEAHQALEAQVRDMDVLIRHMPFVMAATMDARMSDLRNALLSAMAQWHGHGFIASGQPGRLPRPSTPAASSGMQGQGSGTLLPNGGLHPVGALDPLPDGPGGSAPVVMQHTQLGPTEAPYIQSGTKPHSQQPRGSREGGRDADTRAP